jgi:N-acylneuraminate cytidylyltransferase
MAKWLHDQINEQMVKDQIVNKVRLFLTDVDGCLTDGGMYYSAEGEVLKRFCVYDGMGMVCLQQAGIPCGILTSENSPLVKARAEKLKLQYLYLGVGSKVNPNCLTKLQAASEICAQLGITLDEVCYVGDDINDIDLLRAVGYPCCPPNARPEVKALTRASGAKNDIQILATPGGQGAIREIADQILKKISKK